jgi:hypothetical protein
MDINDTDDPNGSRHAVIMISAVWGLAADAVEGVGVACQTSPQTTRSTGALSSF